MNDWFKVIIPHCDGALFQGYSKEPTKYKDKNFYFRGNSIIRNTFKAINDKIKGTKDYQLLLTGSGLGAIGAMIWARYQKDIFPSSI